MEVTFPPDISIRDAMRVMYHTNLMMQYELQVEAISKKINELQAAVSVSGFKNLLEEVRKKWEHETGSEFTRMKDKFGHVEPPLLPDDTVWTEVTNTEWQRVVKRLDAENKKKTVSMEKKKALEAKASMISSEATLNNPKSLYKKSRGRP